LCLCTRKYPGIPGRAGPRATGAHAGSHELTEFAPAGGPQPEPGATATELAGHNRPEVVGSIRAQFGQRMAAEDIADITHIVTRPRYVAVDEMLIRPTEQEQ
jgi:hypothetical protein